MPFALCKKNIDIPKFICYIGSNGVVVQFWLERWPVTPEVASSSLVGPAITPSIGGEMASTILSGLKLQAELSVSKKHSKKKESQTTI